MFKFKDRQDDPGNNWFGLSLHFKFGLHPHFLLRGVHLWLLALWLATIRFELVFIGSCHFGKTIVIFVSLFGFVVGKNGIGLYCHS